ncbi:MAG: membrane protein insertase YidC [Blastocatellia bacterium]|nr:membrane protein insertase YidC [Blastocatellia bacterium]
MEKRFIVFIVVSFAILAGWQYAMSRFYPAPTKPTAQQQQPAQQNSSQPVQPQTTPTSETTTQAVAVETAPPRNISVETPLWKAVFDNKGGVLKSFSIKKMPNGRQILASDYKTLELISAEGIQKVGAPLRLEVNQNPDLTKKLNNSYYLVESTNDTIQIEKGQKQSLLFKLQDSSGLVVVKKFNFDADNYLFDIEVEASINKQSLETNLIIGPNFGDQSVKTIDTYINTPQQVIVETGNNKVNYLTGSSLEHRSAPPDKQRDFTGDISWIGASDHYFVMTVVPPKEVQKAAIFNDFYKDTVDGKEVYKHLLSVQLPVVNKESYKVFIGPKDRELLYEASAKLNHRVDLEDLIDYGFFSIVVKPIIPALDLMLKLFYKFTNNYGLAIILLTFIVNMFFFPLKWKSSVAMKKTVKLQPKMKEIQEKMKNLKKDDPKMMELQMEQMRLMKEGNPISGCLPLFLQMPIFWAFFIFLSISLDIRHSPFIFWIKDLAAADKTWILPIIMTLSMMGATALTPTPSDPAQKMQKIITSFVMPVVFLVFFFANAPSGLVLYWMFGNIIGIAQQLIINKMTEEPSQDQKPPADAKTKKNSTDNKNTAKTGDLADVRSSSSR